MKPKNIYLQELLTAGFVLGLLYSIQQIAIYSFGINNSAYNWIFFVYGVSVIAFTQLTYTRHVAATKPAEQGFSYAQSLGFMVLCSTLAGVIVGIVSYLIQNVIDPAYGELIYQQAWEQASLAVPNATEKQMDMAMSVTRAMMGIWGMIASNMLSLLLNGTLIGLITSAFVKRNADIFANTNQTQQ